MNALCTGSVQSVGARTALVGFARSRLIGHASRQSSTFHPAAWA